jgi:hypothetical protein
MLSRSSSCLSRPSCQLNHRPFVVAVLLLFGRGPITYKDFTSVRLR